MRALAFVAVAACSVGSVTEEQALVTPSCAVNLVLTEGGVVALMATRCGSNEPGHRAVIDLNVAALRPSGPLGFGHLRQYVPCVDGWRVVQEFPFPEWAEWADVVNPQLHIFGILRDPPSAPVTCETPTPTVAEKTNGAR